MGLIEEIWAPGTVLRSGSLSPRFVRFARRGFDLDHVVVQRWFRNTRFTYVFNAGFNLVPTSMWFNEQFLEANIASWTEQSYPWHQYVRRFAVRGLWIGVNTVARGGGIGAIIYAYGALSADNKTLPVT
jgi:hypothetical protein